MSATVIDTVISFVIGMILSIGFHFYFAKQKHLEEYFLSSIIAITLSAVISISAVAIFFWNSDDFVYDLSITQYLLPLGASLLILVGVLLGSVPYLLISTAIACLFSVYYTGITINFSSELPSWLNMFMTSVCLWLFSGGFYCISGLSPFPQSQGITPALGIIILAFLGMAPFVLGISAAALLGVLIVAYARSFSQPINQDCAIILGYIIGWLGLISCAEYLLPCFIIFMMYYLSEASVALFRKIMPLEKYKNIPYNTTLYQAYIEKAPEQNISSVIWLTSLLLILLGVIQINGDNAFSLPVFAYLFCAWQQYRTIHWQTPKQTLKETNQEVINSIKATFASLFQKNDDNQQKDDK